MSDLTDGERAYLRSGGEDKSGLSAEQLKEITPEPAAGPQDGGAQQPDMFPQEQQQAAGGAPEGPGGDPDADDVVTIDEQTGIARRKGKFASKTDYVPQKALHAERERAKRAQEEARQAREEAIATRERLRVLEEATQAAFQQRNGREQPPSPIEEEPIDPNVDVFGALEQANRRIAYLAEQQRNVQSGIAANQEQATLAQSYRADAASFAREKPDFFGAYNHLLGSRKQELAMFGMSQQQADAQARSEELQMVKMAMQRGMRPAEYVYQMATYRGWRPEMAAPSPAPTPQAPPPPSPAMQRMQQQQQHRQQFTTLSGGGGSGNPPMSLAALLDMPQSQFERARKELGDEGWQRLLEQR